MTGPQSRKADPGAARQTHEKCWVGVARWYSACLAQLLGWIPALMGERPTLKKGSGMGQDGGLHGTDFGISYQWIQIVTVARSGGT